MNRMRIALATVVLGLAALAFPLAAYAAGPVLSPHAIVTEGFETTPGAGLTITRLTNLGVPSPATWGRVTQSFHSGSWGLWCAGSNGFASVYTSGTAGDATWDIPQMADYYSAVLDFWYVQRTLGSADENAFVVRWSTYDQSSWGWDGYSGEGTFPLTSVWLERSWNLARKASTFNLSRQPSYVQLRFMNQDPGNFGGAPFGTGPTVDDLTVTGWKYGPVRNLGLVMNGNTAHLTWDTPWRSTATTSTEERPITYRVYRELDGSNAWTELTDARITANSFDDTDTAALDGTYRYVVQAWDAGAGDGYGQVVLPDDSVAQAFAPAPSAPLFSVLGIPSKPTSHTVTPSIDTTTASPLISATLDGNPYLFTGLTGAPVPAAGVHTLIVRVTGPGGTTEHPAAFTIDTTAPATTDNHPTGTVTTTVTVLLNAVDDISGVDATYYRLDGGPLTKYAGGVPMTTWKTHTLAYFSIDKAGNTEAAHAITVAMRQPTALSIAKSGSTWTHAHTYTLSGYLTPGGSGAKVTFQYRRPGSSHWYSATRTTTSSSGRGKWSYSYKPPVKGTYYFKVSFAGSSTQAASASSQLTVKVK